MSHGLIQEVLPMLCLISVLMLSDVLQGHRLPPLQFYLSSLLPP